MQRGWVQSLVGELRSHMLCGQKMKNTNKGYFISELRSSYSLVHPLPEFSLLFSSKLMWEDLDHRFSAHLPSSVPTGPWPPIWWSKKELVSNLSSCSHNLRNQQQGKKRERYLPTSWKFDPGLSSWYRKVQSQLVPEHTEPSKWLILELIDGHYRKSYSRLEKLYQHQLVSSGYSQNSLLNMSEEWRVA